MTNWGPVEKSIRHSIQKNGYPEKAVRLPFRPIFEACKKHEIALQNVLENLNRAEDIHSKLTGDHIIFFALSEDEEGCSDLEGDLEWGPDSSDASQESEQALDPEGIDYADAMRSAFAQMTPDQIADIQQGIANMSEEDKNQLMQIVAQMMQPPGDKK